MNDILKPCPFCGGEAWVIQILENLYAVECRKCWTRIGTYQPTKAKAIEAWNRRAERTAKVVCHGTTMGLSFCCGNCGKPVHSEGEYCHHCGAKLDWSE